VTSGPQPPPWSAARRCCYPPRTRGQAAHAAGAGCLLLTHFWPGNNRHQSRAEAAEEFNGPVMTADENLIIPLS
jgi:ribonuclease BN (tRNA processing enzyme)